MAIVLENDYARIAVSTDGCVTEFIDKKTGKNHLANNGSRPVAHLVSQGKRWDASSASASGKNWTLRFGNSGITVCLRVEAKKRYFTFEVISLSGAQVEEITFVDIAVERSREFGACSLALNLKTNVPELPQANTRIRAISYRKFGLEGAKVAVIGCPLGDMRQVMQEVVRSSPALPHSAIGGPWALDMPQNYGSYLFNFDGITEKNVDEWIELAKALGITQIDFHGGSSFRFGDCRPNPELYPEGRKSLKTVIDRLHAAGIAAGLHTYSFFIDKSCPWVTPKPDARLGSDAVFTLAEELSLDGDTIVTVESTEQMSATTGFFERNSVTLRIEEELIVYSGVSKSTPYGFTGCQRGAYGTQASAHPKGAKVYHLKECFGLFAPDGDSSLLEEIAAITADTFNECGFDMIYLDALDGEDVLGGPENGWHYGSKFVFEIWKRLKRPAIQEMSTFHHHLWYVRSRMGAWDHPVRSYKKFVDLHCAANENNKQMFLPSHLGWWALKPVATPDTERTYPDDIEYLCAKAAGTESGLSIMGIDPSSFQKNEALRRLGSVVQKRENIRMSGFFTEEMKNYLKMPNADFTLEGEGKSIVLRPVCYEKHIYEGGNERTHSWAVVNRFEEQIPRIRIEALWSIAPYDSPDAVVLEEFDDENNLPTAIGSPGVEVRVELSRTQVKAGATSGVYRVFQSGSVSEADSKGEFSLLEHGIRPSTESQCGWSVFTRRFNPWADLGNRKGIGVWIRGDGAGETLNFQLVSPQHISRGVADHYVTVDFTGWRYFELLEPEGERSEIYCWPYTSNIYGVYRELINYGCVESLNVWFGGLPEGKEIKCYLSAVKALPIVKNVLRNPKVTIGGQTVEFPVEIESGGYLEILSESDCKLYRPDGSYVRDVKPKGTLPKALSGENKVSFECEGIPGVNARARLTTWTLGSPIR